MVLFCISTLFCFFLSLTFLLSFLCVCVPLFIIWQRDYPYMHRKHDFSMDVWCMVQLDHHHHHHHYHLKALIHHQALSYASGTKFSVAMEAGKTLTPPSYSVLCLMTTARARFLLLLLYFFYLLQLYCSYGISPMGNSGCLPRGKPAATESDYPT